MADRTWWYGGLVALVALSLLDLFGGPVGTLVATTVALTLWAALVVACAIGFAVHLRRIRREIDRDGISLRREHIGPGRRPVCPNPDRQRPRRRCRPGRIRYR